MALTKSDLTHYLANTLHIDLADVTDDTPLFSSGRADSFAVAELILFIESSIGHRLPAMDVTMENFDSIGRIMNLAARQAAG